MLTHNTHTHTHHTHTPHRRAHTNTNTSIHCMAGIYERQAVNFPCMVPSPFIPHSQFHMCKLSWNEQHIYIDVGGGSLNGSLKHIATYRSKCQRDTLLHGCVSPDAALGMSARFQPCFKVVFIELYGLYPVIITSFILLRRL